MQKVNIIGGGLAGSEAAFFLANHGFKVRLFEMRPTVETGAHHTGKLGELVCSNSLKSKELTNACGLLKAEMTVWDSLLIKVASESELPGGNALCVDREAFSDAITTRLSMHPNIEIIYEEVTVLPSDTPLIIASGPLMSPNLTKALAGEIGENFLSFFDASAPIIEKESINMNIAYFKSRYEQGDDAYLNLPFTKEEYERFYQELIGAKLAPIREMDTAYFDGCMPVEVMAKRGKDTLRFGPLKPRGLRRDENHRPYAVLQLRQDNVIGTLFNMVGFQTNLTYPEQRRVFRLIPGLENAEFVRYGLMHRNTYVNAPRVLNIDMSLKNDPNIYIAGQLSGVEGYVESAASGLYVALQIYLKSKTISKTYPQGTMLGNLMYYIVHANPVNFAPMNANFGIFPGATKHNREVISAAALDLTKAFKEALDE